MTSSRWEVQIKNGQNSDGNGWLQGWRGRGSTEIGCPQLTSIRVIRVQTVFEASVWFCYKCSRLVSGSAIGVPDRCLLQLETRL